MAHSDLALIYYLLVFNVSKGPHVPLKQPTPLHIQESSHSALATKNDNRLESKCFEPKNTYIIELLISSNGLCPEFMKTEWFEWLV